MNDGLATPGFGDLLELGLQSFRRLLGERWVVERYSETGRELEPSSDAGLDLVVNITDPSRTSTQVLVECRQHLSPEDAIKVLAVQRRTLRRVYRSDFAAIVIAPWLSPRVRDILSGRDIGHIDLTGNVSLRLEHPGLIIRTYGAQEDPNPTHSGVTRRLSGQKALGLIRLLVDTAPPYRAGKLALLTGLSTGYVSRLLDVMQRQALIVRRGRSIVHVDWPGLIRARASETTLLDQKHVMAIAPNGIASVLSQVRRDAEIYERVAITGSYGLGVIGPVAIGGQLILYVRPRMNPEMIADMLGLLPSENSEVVLIEPGDPVVFNRIRAFQELPTVALSQLAIDCLSGPGRMPAEGEEVLRYMIDHESEWRLPEIGPPGML